MEEILSSIRKIIADDQEAPRKPAARFEPAPPAAPAEAAGEAEEDDDVLELTEVVARQAEETPPAPPVELHPQPPAAPGKPARGFDDEAGGKSQPAKDMPKEGPKVAAQDSEHLVSATVASVSTSALAKLTRAVASDDRPAVIGGGKTVEQLVVELMRPMLKDWLDQNLPGIVERVVEQEVKKLARRAELL